MVDRSGRILVTQKDTDQWMQIEIERRVQKVVLWVFGRAHATMVESQTLQEAWKPELEVHPFVCGTWIVSGSEGEELGRGRKEG